MKKFCMQTAQKMELVELCETYCEHWEKCTDLLTQKQKGPAKAEIDEITKHNTAIVFKVCLCPLSASHSPRLSSVSSLQATHSRLPLPPLMSLCTVQDGALLAPKLRRRII